MGAAMYLVFGQIFGLMLGPPISQLLFGDLLYGIIFGPLVGMFCGIIAMAFSGGPGKDDPEECQP